MQVQYVIEPREGGGFVATVGAPYSWRVEGATEAEVEAALRERAGAAEVRTLDVPAVDNPVMRHAGVIADTAAWELWVDCIRENREREEREEGGRDW